eukprot:gene34837-58782_t
MLIRLLEGDFIINTAAAAKLRDALRQLATELALDILREYAQDSDPSAVHAAALRFGEKRQADVFADGLDAAQPPHLLSRPVSIFPGPGDVARHRVTVKRAEDELIGVSVDWESMCITEPAADLTLPLPLIVAEELAKAAPKEREFPFGLTIWRCGDGGAVVRCRNPIGGTPHSPMHDIQAWLPPFPQICEDEYFRYTADARSSFPWYGVVELCCSREPSSKFGDEGWECSSYGSKDVSSIISDCYKQKNQQVLAPDLCNRADELTKIEPRASRREPTPERIVRAFTVQKLMWHGTEWLLSLSGRPRLATHMASQRVEEIVQLSESTMRQPYALSTEVMRNVQTQSHDTTLIVSDEAGECSGRYVAVDAYERQLRAGVCELRSLLPNKDVPDSVRCGGDGRVDAGGGGRKLTDEQRARFCELAEWRLLRVAAEIRRLALSVDGVECAIPDKTPRRFAVGDRVKGRNHRWDEWELGTVASATVFNITGSGCRDVSPASRFAREREWLYPSNSVFKVLHTLSAQQQEALGKTGLQVIDLNEIPLVKAQQLQIRSLLSRAPTAAAAQPIFFSEAAV